MSFAGLDGISVVGGSSDFAMQAAQIALSDVGMSTASAPSLATNDSLPNLGGGQELQV